MQRGMRVFLGSCLLVAAAGCTAAKMPVGPAPDGPLDAYPVFTAGDALLRDWLHFRIWRETEWRLAAIDDEIVIAATGDGSSSGIGRWVDIDTATCPALEWSWRVDALPEHADLTRRDRDDVAASLILAFGDPSSMSNPRPVPTIRYVWSAAANPVDAVVDSPFFPGTLRSIVVRSGADALGTWVTERRDLREDYRLAFGEPPAEAIQVFALFTDNDHLREPVKAYYRRASVLCTEKPGGIHP